MPIHDRVNVLQKNTMPIHDCRNALQENTMALYGLEVAILNQCTLLVEQKKAAYKAAFL